MLISGVPARARRTRRRLATRCCRHKVAFPQKESSGKVVEHPGRGPERALLRLFIQVNRAPAACEITNLA
jgi:hypothetical protein